MLPETDKTEKPSRTERLKACDYLKLMEDFYYANNYYCFGFKENDKS